MKIVNCFLKTFKENLRDWKILILAIVFAPFFVYLMYMYMGNHKSSLYNIVVINNDDGGLSSGRTDLPNGKNLKTNEGNPVLRILQLADSSTANKMIKNRETDLVCNNSARFFRIVRDLYKW